jgi:cardiolipin synthase (CMP-forming)
VACDNRRVTASPRATRADWATWPNLLSVLRLAALPWFAWLVLAADRPGAATLLLIAAAATDFLDGVIARRFGQESALGRLLDPLADRVTSFVVPVVLAVDGIVPWWLVGVLLARDVVVAVAAARLLGRRRATVAVTFLGKAATLCLLAAFPLVLAGSGEGSLADVAGVTGWAFLVWGVFLYWWSALVYLQQISSVLIEGDR